jgi:hypothetical protein
MDPRSALLFLILLETTPAEHAPAPAPQATGIIRTDWNDYAWPTEAGRIVTSTFGEYRSTHFHAGIDISSGDVTGYGVFASRSGYVARIRISPVGYGKILYVRHADGFTTTYAHLERFSPALEERAVREQKALGRYPVDIACTPEEFPLRKGDLIGHTGQTGAASPHLHFEIRDPLGNPVNPFLAPGLRVRDTIPPTITRISVSPLSPEATVNGERAPKIFRAESVRGGTMRISAPIVITGEAGFALESLDRIPGSRFRNGVYTRTLSIDGAPVFTERMDETPWTEAHEIDLCFEQELQGARRGRFARLYMDSPNHIRFYAPPGPRAGVVDCASLAPGTHTFRIISADFQGNNAALDGTFVVSRVPAGRAERIGNNVGLRMFSPGDVGKIRMLGRTGRGTWSRSEWVAPPGGFASTMTLPVMPGEFSALTVTLENRWGTFSAPMLVPAAAPGGSPPALHLTCEPEEDYVRVRLTARGELTSPPSVTVREGSLESTVLMSPADPEEFEGWFRPREEYRGDRIIRAESFSGGERTADSAAIDIQPVLPGTTGEISADGGRLIVRYDSLSVLKPLFLRIEKSTDEEGTVYSLEPGGEVLGSGLTVKIRPGSPGGHAGLFSRPGGSWHFIGSRTGGEDPSCTGRIEGRLCDVTLLADSTPPSLVRFSVARRARSLVEITVRFRDDLSGVEYDDLKMYIDGNTVIPEIDGRRQRAVYQATEPLGRGPHQLTLHLADRIGNSGTTGRRFVIP